jgi:UDPglucose 6-dehydrogenase
MRASVVGLGQLGAPLVAVLAKSGLEVCGIDLNPDKVEKLASGIAPVREPRLQQLMTAHRARIRATSDWRAAIAAAEVTFVLVPTPSGADGAFRNDHLLAAIEEIARVIKTKSAYHLVVVGSTVMPGTVGGPIRQRLETVSGKRVGRDIGLCYNPEFIALGNVVAGLLRPDFVVIGESDERAGAMLAAIWRRMAGDRVPISRMNFINAELTKLAVNTYVTGKISFANMLGEICDNLVDADVDVVTATIGQDTRIGGKYLRGATGYGGPCFPRDTLAFTTMARQAGVEANLAAAAQAINDRQLDRVREIVLARTGAADRIAVLGLAYKPDTAVIEHAQGVMLAAALDKLGRRVVVHDPLALAAARAALGPGVSFAASAAAAVATAEAVAVMLPCAEYQAFFAAWSGAGPTRLVVDCWRLVDAALSSHRLHIVQLGRNTSFVAPQGAAIASAAD